MKFIDSTNYIGKEESGWNALGMLDGFSGSGFLYWIYEYEATTKPVDGTGNGTATVPYLPRIQAYANRVSSTYCVIDVETPEVNFANQPDIVAKYLRVSEVANPNTTWIWYNTQEFPVTWPVTRKPTPQELKTWWKRWEDHQWIYDQHHAGILSYYTQTMEQLENFLPYMVEAFARAFGDKPKIWNTSFQTYEGDDAMSPNKDLGLFEAELQFLREALHHNLIDYVCLWGLFNESLPRRDITNESDLIALLQNYVA